MRIKSYFAPSVQAAISLARKEFDDRVTLVTSHVASLDNRHLGAYEVVFAIEENTEPEVAPAPPEPLPQAVPLSETPVAVEILPVPAALPTPEDLPVLEAVPALAPVSQLDPPPVFNELLRQAILAPPPMHQDLPEKLEHIHSSLVALGLDASLVRAFMTMLKAALPATPAATAPEAPVALESPALAAAIEATPVDPAPAQTIPPHTTPAETTPADTTSADLTTLTGVLSAQDSPVVLPADMEPELLTPAQTEAALLDTPLTHLPDVHMDVHMDVRLDIPAPVAVDALPNAPRLDVAVLDAPELDVPKNESVLLPVLAILETPPVPEQAVPQAQPQPVAFEFTPAPLPEVIPALPSPRPFLSLFEAPSSQPRFSAARFSAAELAFMSSVSSSKAQGA